MASALFFSTHDWTPKEHPICYRVTHTRQPQFKAGIPKSEKTAKANHKNHLIQTLLRYTTKDTQNSIQDYPETQKPKNPKTKQNCSVMHASSPCYEDWVAGEEGVYEHQGKNVMKVNNRRHSNSIQDCPKIQKQNKNSNLMHASPLC